MPRRCLSNLACAPFSSCLGGGFACEGGQPQRWSRLVRRVRARRRSRRSGSRRPSPRSGPPRRIGAERAPQAKLHLQAARDTLAAAKETNKDDPEGAARKLDIARAQAELANALAREQMAKNELDGARTNLEALKTSAQTTGGSQ